MKGEASVVIVGGGIAGIQASLDLADRGFRVYLVEKSPSIGGKMALLDKTFPTMDCSICILGPKMVEVYRHPNISLFTCSEVSGLSGSSGDFTVEITRRPRFIDEASCVGCGVCAAQCPVRVQDEFQMGLGTRRAVYIPFPQAVPLVYTISRDHCLYLTKGVCRICEKVCEVGAVDFSQREERLAVKAAAVIVATGLAPFDPSGIKEYGYGRHRDVVTAMELEVMFSATGPTRGRLLRPSDGRAPKRVGFIQCVGSRSLVEGYPYCSSVCCMHAAKEALLVKEHEPDAEVHIFHTDIRAYGKGFNEFVERVRTEHGVIYIRAKPSEIRRDHETGALTFWYEDTLTGEMREARLDLVVLCTALTPSRDNAELARMLGVEIDEFGFFKRPDPILTPFGTTRAGILACGFCQGPKDIPDAVAEAGGAAAAAAGLVESPERGGRIV